MIYSYVVFNTKYFLFVRLDCQLFECRDSYIFIVNPVALRCSHSSYSTNVYRLTRYSVLLIV